jgi:F-type H+-transporting ATPase subunit b
MELITPDLGLVFWMLVSFSIVFFILKKFAWPLILNSLKEREKSIENAIKAAERAKEEMQEMQASNQQLLESVNAEKAKILQESMELKDKIMEEARIKAVEESDKMIEKANQAIENEKRKALKEMKDYMVDLSVQIAEKIIQKDLHSSNDQEAFIKKQIDDLHIN